MNYISTLLVMSLFVFGGVANALPAPKMDLDIPYAETSTSTDVRKLDVYHALHTKGDSPALIWFHGGGLTSGTKNGDLDKKFSALWQAQGVTLINVDYRLSPAVAFPAYIEDAASAVAWTFRNAKRLKIDSKRIFIGGYSAGGYLTSMLALAPTFLTNKGINPDQVKGYISLSGQMTTHFTVRKERGMSDLPVIVDDAAPSYYVSNNPPPMLLLIGDNDWPARLEENQLIYAQFKQLAKTNNIQFHIINNRDHRTIFEKIPEPDDEVFKFIWDFIGQHKNQ